MTGPNDGGAGQEDRPRLSVITIGRDVRDELDRCLTSIERHAPAGSQVLVVDNASTDGTVRWLAQEWPDVEVIALDRNLFGAARNAALGRVRAPYTMFLDSDAELTEGAADALLSALEDSPEVGLLGPRLVYADGTLQLSCRRYPPALIPLMRRPPLAPLFEHSTAVRRHLMEDIDHSLPRPVLYTLGACQVFRSELIEKLGRLDPRMGWGGEDIDWCIRVWDAGAEVRYEPNARVVHAYRRQSKAAPLSLGALRHLRSFAALQWKYRARYRELMRFCDELDRRAARER